MDEHQCIAHIVHRANKLIRILQDPDGLLACVQMRLGKIVSIEVFLSIL
jgi:hypothetical protein